MNEPHATIESYPGAFESLERLRELEKLLDHQFSLGGINFGIDGIDGIIGLVPAGGKPPARPVFT